MKTCAIALISVFALIIGLSYQMNSAVQISNSTANRASLLLIAAEAEESASDQSEDKKDETPGIDRIGCCVMYG